jgi:hypothetical protein
MRPAASLLISAVALLLAQGCSGQWTAASPTHPPLTNSLPPAATLVDGGCGFTSVVKGQVPPWVDEAGAHNNPDSAPYFITVPANAAGFIFGYPLRAGHPESPSNKILWVVGLARNGSALEITGYPVGATTPTVDVVQPANSGPGEIYPSIVDVPQPGCWHFDLAWAGHNAAVELVYQ